MQLKSVPSSIHESCLDIKTDGLETVHKSPSSHMIIHLTTDLYTDATAAPACLETFFFLGKTRPLL